MVCKFIFQKIQILDNQKMDWFTYGKITQKMKCQKVIKIKCPYRAFLNQYTTEKHSYNDDGLVDKVEITTMAKDFWPECIAEDCGAYKNNKCMYFWINFESELKG